MAEQDKNEETVEQDRADRKQAILIAAATGVVVFAVLTAAMLVAKSALGPSKKSTPVAKAPQGAAEPTGTSQSAPTPPDASPPPKTPPAAAPKSPAATAPKDSPLPIPGLPPVERPRPIPGMPAPSPESPSFDSPDEGKIPESSFITGEIVPLDESILNPTEEDFRRRKAMELESSLDSYQARLASLEAGIAKCQEMGDKATVAELEAKAAETRASIQELQAKLARLGPVGDDPFAKIGTSPRVAGHSARPFPRPSPRPSRKRVAVPSSELQQEANKQLEEIYDFSKPRKDEEELALAKELYGLGVKAPAGSAEKFVILRKTAETASTGGDAVLMLEAVDRMAHNFEMDGLMAKGTLLKKFAKGATNSKKIGSLVRAAQRYAGEAIAAGKPDFAQGVATLTYQASQRPQGKEFRKEALEFRRKVQKACGDQQKLKDAKTAIEADPEDKDAHLALGELYCFGRGDWPHGLPHLAKGSDAGLAAAAKQELARPTSAAGQARVGDAWWDAAKSRTDDEKKNLMLHAAEWYKRALPGLSGLDKAKVSRRLGEVGELVGPKAPSEPKERDRGRPIRTRPTTRSRRPPDAVQFGGHWYKAFLAEKGTWAQAHQACQQMGGHLVCVESEAEKHFVSKLAESAAWVGALSNAQGQWFWVTGQPIASRYWENDYRPREGARAMVQRAAWRDRGHTDRYGFICEWDR